MQIWGRHYTQHNDIQHNDTRHKGLIFNTQHNNTAIVLSVTMLNVIMLSVVAPIWDLFLYALASQYKSDFETGHENDPLGWNIAAILAEIRLTGPSNLYCAKLFHV
jgi:hypothetical protein